MARRRSKAVGKEDAETEALMDSIPPPAESKQRRALEKVAKRFTKWRPASEELTLVRAVPTRFPQFDRATRVGGFPIERVCTVHGPSGMGKTLFGLGLIDSFLELDHPAALVDAEFTTPFDFAEKLMGANARHPGFFAKRPGSYEETVGAVREFVNLVDEVRAEGTVAEDTSGIVVVDSIRKLIPADLLDKVMKAGKGDTVEMLRGRAGQWKAALTQGWLDELTPLLARTHTVLVMIAREFEREGASLDDKLYDNAWTVGGGKGVIFDASLVCRITRASWVYEGSGESKVVVGERHRVRIWKSKVESHEGKYVDCYFSTSNGEYPGIPEGFDRARDVLELAEHYGVVEVKGAWVSYGGERLGQGKNTVVRLLHEKSELCAEVEGKVRQAFRPDEALEGGAEQ